MTKMTCCGVCSSLKSGAYFVTSVQVFIGLYLFYKWAIVTFIKGNYEEYFEEDRQKILYPLVLIYIAVFIVLGSVNFIAVQKESANLIRNITKLFLVLQALEILNHIILGFSLAPEHEDPEMYKMWHLQRLVASLVGTSVYAIVLFLASRSITRRRKRYEIEDRYEDPPVNRKGNRSRIEERDEEEEEAASPNTTLRPTAPPATPQPEEPKYADIDDVDAEVDDFVDVMKNQYVAGPDKKTALMP